MPHTQNMADRTPMQPAIPVSNVFPFSHNSRQSRSYCSYVTIPIFSIRKYHFGQFHWKYDPTALIHACCRWKSRRSDDFSVVVTEFELYVPQFQSLCFQVIGNDAGYAQGLLFMDLKRSSLIIPSTASASLVINGSPLASSFSVAST